MKNLFALLLLAVLTFTANAQNPDSYKLNKGDKFEMTAVVSQDIEQTMMGQSSVTKQEVTTVDMLEVTEVADGVYTIQSTGIKRSFTLSGMMNTAMDSEKEGIENLPFKVMVDKSYSFRMNSKGDVIELIGLEEMRQAMIDELSGTQYSTTAEQITSVFTKEAVLQAQKILFYIYPETGEEEWERTAQTAVNNIPVDFVSKYYWQENAIFSEATVAIDSDFEMQGMTFSSKMSGDQNSIIDVNQQSGMITKVQTIQSIKGDLVAQGMTIPMTIETESTTTFVKQ